MTGTDFSVAPAPKVIYVNPLPIKIYQVTEEKLNSIKVASSSASQDFGFMVGAIGVLVTALGTLTTLNPTAQPLTFAAVIFTLVTIAAAVVGLYTGVRWLRQRNAVSEIIKGILAPNNTSH